ncbi:peptide-methionine (S)-S-oxide reductase MsrA [Flammeovirgaceae bacterium SG7u.111]|nr:peptide-methionine (S)-S-oxide reductase MsrA [Flammeovirgaceae bacterium SG7u.132]WPO37898.1 peptide-methionine (S)-S-oxide reductase MsrA [Flammeovirgaceae bacterium SG7u.111]
MIQDKLEYATLGGGCFWCLEAVYEKTDGVVSVISGYTGGKLKNPTYNEICTGKTGHAEVVQVAFDPKVISYEEVLDIFWKIHDPTTLNKQGNDVGTQYRSAIFYHNQGQKVAAEKAVKEVGESGLWSDPIVTQVTALDVFYKAEDYHQEYYQNNPNQPYCIYVVKPKVEKFEKLFKEKVKAEF